jgi:glycosyltransferase involved in cell wall biosynthesis
MITLREKLTVILPTFNESHRLNVALRNFCSKTNVIVVDNFSSDGTKDLAEEMGVVVVQRKNAGFATREDYEFMFSLASTEWILIAYAGHHFSAKLMHTIETAIMSDRYDAICLSGVAIQYGKKTNVYGWNRRPQIATPRLFKKSAIDLSKSRIHHELPYCGPLDRVYFPPLKCDYYIQNYRDDDFGMMIRKTLIYSEEEARSSHAAGHKISALKAYCSFFFHLGKRLFWRLGILEGVPGLIVAISEAYRSFAVDARLWELSSGFDSANMKIVNVEKRDKLLKCDGR